MLVKLLSKSDKDQLLEFAELLALVDKPLLWDGKKQDEITLETRLDQLSIQKGELETALIAELKSERERVDAAAASSAIAIIGVAGLGRAIGGVFPVADSVESKLIEKMKTFPLQKIDDPEIRTQAASIILKELLTGTQYELPSVPKLMLFELMLLALCDGSISDIQLAVLKEFQRHHQLEDFVFDELLERAEIINRDVSRTISFILE